MSWIESGLGTYSTLAGTGGEEEVMFLTGPVNRPRKPVDASIDRQVIPEK